MATISIRPNLWTNWARIAFQAEARAIAAYTAGLSARSEISEYLAAMTSETMIAVVAVRSSFHHAYLDWHQLLGLEARGDEDKVPELATTDIPAPAAARAQWLASIKKVVHDRDEITHRAQDAQAAVPHPLGTNTSALNAYFVPNLATEAVDVMLDFYRRVLTSPAPSLRGWAEDRSHVLGSLQSQRKRFLASP